LRKTFAALVSVLLAGLLCVIPAAAPVARATAGVKVAIIVGATHDMTPTYRAYADEIYREAILYTSNVVRVYSPNATATRVQAAVAGASIIVYLGHGNGWPSPYTYDPAYTTKDGFGLNYDANGDGRTTDYENKYYGEPWIRALRPAPNAVVLLFHLCYASGNPESGASEPVIANARQRVDNYAAAFIAAGARAVIANGHSHDPYYIRALFTTRQTIDQYWRNAPDAHNRVSAYPSARSAGSTYQMDPESTGKYYRSIAGKMSLETRDVTGALFADTSADPAAMVVPGNASPAADGAPVFGSAASAAAGTDPIATLGPTAKVRVDALEPALSASAVSAADSTPVYRVHAGEVEGWMTGAALVPRDSAAPRVWTVDDGTGAFSPNGDGSQDSLPLSIRLSESAAWTIRLLDANGGDLARADGSSDTARLTWAPAAGSVPDGTYRWALGARDAWGNGPLEAGGTVVVDTTPPKVAVAETADPVRTFTPNGDGASDTIGFTVGSSEPGSVTATIKDPGEAAVDHVAVVLAGSTAALTWDGRTTSGAYAPDGVYALIFVATDRAGNRSEAQARSANAYGALGYTASSPVVFFPQDGDNLARTTSFSFKLRSAATVSWTVQDAAGTVVRTIQAEGPLAAGPHAFAWDGRNDAGAMVPRGVYRTVVHATDGTLASTQRASVVADAFRISVSDTTPRRGQRMTITARSAEALSKAPRLSVYQPGASAWSVTMSRVAPGVYRATVTLRSSRTGTLRLQVSAYDDHGVMQRSNLYLPLH
jgi:flagellar hook assembly protein FlgD